MIKLMALAFLLLAINSYSQINVGANSQPEPKVRPLIPDDLAKLKSSTTIFAVPVSETDYIADYEKAFEQSWTIAKYKVIPYSELQDYYGKKNYSFLSFAGYSTHTTGKTISYSSTHLYLQLWVPGEDKKGEFQANALGFVEIYPTFEFLTKIEDEESDDAVDFIYTNVKKNESIYNLSAGLLKCYLLTLNSYLTKGTSHSLFSDKPNLLSLGKLRSDTLLIPDYVLVKFDKFSGDESKKQDEKDLMKDYPYPYKILSSSELSEKILNAEKPLHVFIYIKSSADKFINVYSTATGLIYAAYHPMSYNLKSRDFDEMIESKKK